MATPQPQPQPRLDTPWSVTNELDSLERACGEAAESSLEDNLEDIPWDVQLEIESLAVNVQANPELHNWREHQAIDEADEKARLGYE